MFVLDTFTDPPGWGGGTLYTDWWGLLGGGWGMVEKWRGGTLYTEGQVGLLV